jgi:hypothetical protein
MVLLPETKEATSGIVGYADSEYRNKKSVLFED